MTTSSHLSRAERVEMCRAHAGLVTALVQDDVPAVHAQLRGIIEDHARASYGDFAAFAARMAKQVEAGARVTRQLLISLSSRLDLSESELQQIIAQTYNGDIDGALPE